MSYNERAHKQILTDILTDIYNDTRTATALSFKGGTAAYLFYGLNRGSLDLDFDLRPKADQAATFELVKKIVQKYGVLKDEAITDRGMYVMISYSNNEHATPNIKVDINLRDFGSRYDILSLNGLPMPVMVKEDMAAHKLVAMKERMGKANRDIYDVWYFLSNAWPVNRDLVESRSNKSYAEHLTDCIDVLSKFDNHHVLNGMGELLIEKQKVWVRANLVAETIRHLKRRLELEQ